MIIRFACVGLASTVVYALLYLALRDLGVAAQGASAASLFLTALTNTAANRRFTFEIRGREDAGRHQIYGLIAFAAGLAVTACALAVLHAVSASPGREVEVSVLILANLAATAARFILYRYWVFRPAAAR
ncbi:MAG TPA: GtrA family protein [Streptosporangiaceae bacterium]|nr:GtrA family protein [Streptosporangiaceae bacterium]